MLLWVVVLAKVSLIGFEFFKIKKTTTTTTITTIKHTGKGVGAVVAVNVRRKQVSEQPLTPPLPYDQARQTPPLTSSTVQ